MLQKGFYTHYMSWEKRGLYNVLFTSTGDIRWEKYWMEDQALSATYGEQTRHSRCPAHSNFSITYITSKAIILFGQSIFICDGIRWPLFSYLHHK